MEQKNWAVVRRMVGYFRYDTEDQLRLLNALYERLRLYTNFFRPAQKLLCKERNGAKVRRVHDVPQTPYQRVLSSPSVTDQQKAALTQLYLSLNPAALRRQITQLQVQLLGLAMSPTSKPRNTEEVYTRGNESRLRYLFQ